ncbi:MAG: hypothetical protein DHS20C20_00290 [Ardenticatenaceae bacterium]|nr:MAG: hypothetical protein DHS20C20_00290 [Ardenticatenaceae bacterium]
MSEYRHLYSLIEDVFDLNGIRTLCMELKFETGVDITFENLAGDTIRRKAQELQEYARRNGITPELLQVIHSLKPRIDLTKFGGPEPDLSKPDRPINNEAASGGGVKEAKEPEPPKTVYDNFDIVIRSTDKEFEYWLEAKSPMGDTVDPIRQKFPFEDDNYQYLRKLLADVRLAEPKNAEEMGELLRKFLFPAQIQSKFRESLSVVKRDGKEGLRVRLNIPRGKTELYQVPWEYVRDDKAFLALNDNTPLVRYLPTDKEPVPISAPTPIKILLAWANPEDLPELKVDGEINAIKEALKSLTKSGKVIIDELPNVTPMDLFSKVASNPPHIFHFIGHGVMDSENGAAIALNDGENKHALMDAGILQEIFQEEATKLIIFSACQTGSMGDKSSDSNSSYAFMGLAPRLVWGGIPAVIAMQFDLPNKAAKPFVEPLYKFLASGKPLDWAISKARLSLRVAGLRNAYWGIPVLFMRSPDGNIWV